jgi:predicted DNA-binding transcriptional regulator AlpA
MPKKKQDRIEPLALTINEAAQIARCSVGHFYQLWKRGEGPKRTRIGQWKIVVLREELERWLREQQEQTAATNG